MIGKVEKIVLGMRGKESGNLAKFMNLSGAVLCEC